MEKFYIYEWFNTETNEVFYVGKGIGNRYKQTAKRNKYFLEYLNINKTDVRIVQYFDDEQKAYEEEFNRIAHYKAIQQCSCNLMSGGFGGNSESWTDEMRKYMSEFNPMKKEEQRQRMSESNPMKRPEVAQKVGSAHKRPIIINGVEYEGIVDAARELGVWENTVLNWCKRGYDTQGNPCRYKDKVQKKYEIKKTCSRKVSIDGVEYSSLRAACDAIGVKDTSPLCKALKANRTYRGHVCKYVDQQPS